MAYSKLEAMAIYVVKQACGNDILASVQKGLIFNDFDVKWSDWLPDGFFIQAFCVVANSQVATSDLRSSKA